MTDVQDNWRDLYEGEWDLSKEATIHRLAKEYHDKCDTHDALICGNLEGIPMTGHELAAINKHAKKVLRRLEDKALQSEISADDLLREIRRLSK